jgi:hypothetical protein
VTRSLVLALLLPALAGAQQSTAPSSAATTQTSAAEPVLPDSAARLIEVARQDSGAPRIPPLDSISTGNRVVQRTERVPGSVVVLRGNVDVYGVVDGDAIALGGDVIVHEGGRVHGDAFAAFGDVRLAGGVVQGRSSALRGSVAALPAVVRVPKPDTTPRSGWQATRDALGVSVGWLAVLLGIGIAAFMFAGAYLEIVMEAIERRFARAFWTGLAGQFAMLPVLLLLVVGLAITVIGLLLVPFAVVAFALGVAGVTTLGFLAMAQTTGRSVLGRSLTQLSAQGAALKALMFGVALYVGLWIVAAAFAWSPVLLFVLRAIAFVLTWVAATVGLGAVLLTRGGTRRVGATTTRAVPAPDPSLAWQTPTPVTGVVAARRPTPAPSAGDVTRR